MRRDSLGVLDKTMNPKLWVYLDQQVNMVGHDFQRDDFRPVFLGYLFEDGCTTFRYVSHEHRSSVLRTEHDVVLAGVHDVVVRLVSYYHEHIIQP